MPSISKDPAAFTPFAMSTRAVSESWRKLDMGEQKTGVSSVTPRIETPVSTLTGLRYRVLKNMASKYARFAAADAPMVLSGGKTLVEPCRVSSSFPFA